MSSMILQIRVDAARAAYGVAIYTYSGVRLLTAFAPNRPCIYKKRTAQLITYRYNKTTLDAAYQTVPLPYAGDGFEIEQ